MATTERALSPTTAPAKGTVGKSNPTGFVLKLNNMVNGASDDVVSWVPSGEAFRISDLARLESETLPQYFRHSRFQSLVRQLNFYNFRKIKRERTFWVYYHPQFHRDRPEEMHKLRRRTCPGFDGRRNRAERAAPPPPTTNITWSNEDEQVIKEIVEEKVDESPEMPVSSPGAAIKVSRSPSPSYSPMDHLPAGRGSVSSMASLRGTSLKSVISEEERSPIPSKQPSRRPSTAAYSNVFEGQKAFNRSVSEDVETNEYYASLKPPADPLQAEEYVVNQLNSHLSTSSFAPVTKKARKAKQTWSDNEDDSSAHSSRKKYSKEEAKERQAQLLAVTEVSRRLDGICADYAASIAASKPRRRGKGRSRMGGADSSSGQALRSTSSSPAFGLEKPEDHYYGPGKCDLLAYDCDDGFTIDVGNEKKDADTPKKKQCKEPREAPVVASPPSQCPVVNQSLLHACMDRRLLGGASTLERTIVSAVLSFCLCTHPQDPGLAQKISAHLQNGPMLAKEFELYRMAMKPGVQVNGGRATACEDLERAWKTFAANSVRRVALAHRERLSAAENEAVERCVTAWVEEI